MTKEIWKTVVGFPNYEVSNTSEIRNKTTRRILKQCFDSSNGYMVVNLFDERGTHRKYVHRLVGEAFIPNPENKRTINHIDCDKTNNRIDNLEWATDSENMRHAFDNGLCENTRRAAAEVGRIYNTGRISTERQRQSARETITKINKRPKTKRQLETSRANMNSMNCKQKAIESHFNRHKPIKVMETGEVYLSQRELAFRLGVSESSIYSCLHERLNHVKGYHLEYTDELPKRPPFLYPYQMEAVNRLKNGCVLNGGVGSGKSRTGLYYYFKKNYGRIDENGYFPMINPQNLLIITTAQKRDSLEWEGELGHFLLSTHKDACYYDINVVIDSWNNIKKYADISGWFVLFDEQRLCGSGAWVKTFLKMAKSNDWILLSATPGDTFNDYVPLFIANGFFKNRTEFNRNHVVFSRFSKYPKIDHYYNTALLMKYRDRILVDMDFRRETKAHHIDIPVEYDVKKYKEAGKTRWDPFKNEPIINASGLCYVWRRIVNTDKSRQTALIELAKKHPRMIVFYNFDHELEILRSLDYGEGFQIAEYNGHKHDPLPTSDRWIYLVNFQAGNAGWNCIKTDTIVFYSQNYSYKVMQQAAGRIDRLNSPFTDLYYYHLKSKSGIDLAISKALREKKNFNEGKFVKW